MKWSLMLLTLRMRRKVIGIDRALVILSCDGKHHT